MVVESPGGRIPFLKSSSRRRSSRSALIWALTRSRSSRAFCSRSRCNLIYSARWAFCLLGSDFEPTLGWEEVAGFELVVFAAGGGCDWVRVGGGEGVDAVVEAGCDEEEVGGTDPACDDGAVAVVEDFSWPGIFRPTAGSLRRRDRAYSESSGEVAEDRNRETSSWNMEILFKRESWVWNTSEVDLPSSKSF